MRKAWKAYTRHMLPHASRQISNFMLACLAEGRNHDVEDEGVFQRGAAMTCELTSQEIANIMNATKQHDKQSAEEEKPSGEGTHSVRARGASGHAKRIIATTSLALRLAEASKCSEEGVAVHAKNLLERQRVGTPVRTDNKEENVEELRQCVVTMHEHDWRAAYTQWVNDVNNKGLQKGVVPNPKQWEILNVVHHRCVAEKTGVEHLTEAPLLRLVHGLPGSGKSKVLEWLRNYFETVWKWTIGHEFVFLAPLSSMASNIGGFTLHGWGEVPFKDARGTVICSRSRDEGDFPSPCVASVVLCDSSASTKWKPLELKRSASSKAT